MHKLTNKGKNLILSFGNRKKKCYDYCVVN